MSIAWQKGKNGPILDILVDENKVLKKAILDIKKHQENVASQEFMGKPMYESSAIWKIASCALEKIGYN